MAARGGGRLLSRALKFTAAGTALGAGAAYAGLRLEYGPDAPSRVARAYADAIPCFAAYKRVEWLHDKLPRLLATTLPAPVAAALPPRLTAVDEAALEAEYQALHAHWAPRLLAAVFDLRGFFLKAGQLVACALMCGLRGPQS